VLFAGAIVYFWQTAKDVGFVILINFFCSEQMEVLARSIEEFSKVGTREAEFAAAILRRQKEVSKKENDTIIGWRQLVAQFAV